MGQMQRRKRKIREAMRQPGKPLPSYQKASRIAWSNYITWAGSAAKVLNSAMHLANSLRAAKKDCANPVERRRVNMHDVRSPEYAETLGKIINAIRQGSPSHIAVISA